MSQLLRHLIVIINLIPSCLCFAQEGANKPPSTSPGQKPEAELQRPNSAQGQNPTVMLLADMGGFHKVDYSPIIAKLKEQLPQQMTQMNVPGLAIALVDGDKLVWAEGFGATDRASQTKVTADTLFSIQSISKTYTATGFLVAVEKGLMKIDDPLKKYYPVNPSLDPH